MTGCKLRRFLAEIVTGSHGSHATAHVCHRRRLSRSHQLLLDTHMDLALTSYGKCSVQASRHNLAGRTAQ